MALSKPLTNWKRDLDHFRGAALISGTTKKPTLLGIHRTRNGQIAITADVGGIAYEYQLQIVRGKCWNARGFVTFRCLYGKGRRSVCKGKLWVRFMANGENQKTWLLSSNPNNDNPNLLDIDNYEVMEHSTLYEHTCGQIGEILNMGNYFI